MDFCMIGGLVLICWMFVYSHELFQQLQYSGIVFGIIFWYLGVFIFWNSPVFEFWNLEKSYAGMGDYQNVYTGAFYPTSLAIILGIIGIAVAFSILFRKRSKITSKIASETSTSIQLSTFKPKKASSIIAVIGIIVSIGLPLGFGGYYGPINHPQILAKMGQEGALWLAGPYDRVDKEYSFNALSDPINSSFNVYAMKGESILNQVVFTNFGNELQTFYNYQYGQSNQTYSDSNWTETTTSISQHINLTCGFVDYVSLYDNQIADILSPWEPRTTDAFQNYPLWLQISVPMNTMPGLYLTYVRINFHSWINKNYANYNLNFSIQLRVWNITLPLKHDIDTTIGIGYDGNGYENLQDLLNLQCEYRADPTVFIMPTISVDFNNLSAGMTIDWSNFDIQVAQLFSEGCSILMLSYFPEIECRDNPQAIIDGSQDNYLTAIRWFYGNASAHLSNKTTPWGDTWEQDMYCRESDEAHADPNIMAAYNIVYGIVKNVSRIRTSQTLVESLDHYSAELNSLDISISE
jgi:hypothetical protein